jgi:23S rRNA (adenine2503-C2)-methyltransferase
LFNLLDYSHLELKQWLKSEKEPVDAADRIWKRLYRQSAGSFEAMTDLSQSLRAKLTAHASLKTIEPLEEAVSSDGQTVKVLLRLDDGQTIEAALMLYRNPVSGRERRTVCVSSQVGCPIGCPFCDTGRQGLKRNLGVGEIIEQVLYFASYLQGLSSPNGAEQSQRRISNVVFMGMGEPLANYDNVIKVIAALNSPKGLGLGNRQVTLSTCGLTPRIQQLAGENLHFELAISLHAVRDELRNRLVPINQKYSLEQLLGVSREFFAKTGRRPFMEYALFEGINDFEADAEGLVSLLGDFKCSINLILGNPSSNREFRPSSMEVALAFQKRLLEAGFRTMIRLSKGADIEAACGQLRSRYLEKLVP